MWYNLTLEGEDAPYFAVIHILENTGFRCHLVTCASKQTSRQTQLHFPLILHSWPCVDASRSHLSSVVHLDLGDPPVAGLWVVLQPGLAGEEAAHAEHPHACQQGEEAALLADVGPGQHRQHLPRERPLHRLVIQGVLLRVPRPGLQLPVRPDLPSHVCYETKGPFFHHGGSLTCSSAHGETPANVYPARYKVKIRYLT